MTLKRFTLLVLGIGLGLSQLLWAGTAGRLAELCYPGDGYPVEQTVATELGALATVSTRPVVLNPEEIATDVFWIAVSRPGCPAPAQPVPENDPWICLQKKPDGTGMLLASHPHLLYLGMTHWLEDSLKSADLEQGILITPTFSWLDGNDEILVGLERFARGYNAETTMKAFARLGISHVTVNALATPFPDEPSIPGEPYYRFYTASPDLDQFVETELNRGSYPPEYLQANLDCLKRNARLALKYGLTPGLTICSPRSVPESLLTQYPHLRGARVDHPYRSYKPRYTLTLSHPVVRWHYAKLMEKLMQEVPELGYAYIWTNDSGSGFEFTSTLYAGRNGGAYLLREWTSDETVAKAAADNALRYYKLLKSAARDVNPEFRVVMNMFAFVAERDYMLDGLEPGLDILASPTDQMDADLWAQKMSVRDQGADIVSPTMLKVNYLLGAPMPWTVHRRLKEIHAAGIDRVMATLEAASLVPFSVNRNVIRAFQLDADVDIDDLVSRLAREQVGAEQADRLVNIWRLSDEAIRAFPPVPLYGNNWAFPWYKPWSRPFVPDIKQISKTERYDYEKFMVSSFNNPSLIDFSDDAMWDLISVEQGDEIIQSCRDAVWPRLNTALKETQRLLEAVGESEPVHSRVLALRHRLEALQIYFTTLKNIGAWVAGVHGYDQAQTQEEKTTRLEQVRDMMESEIDNMRHLLDLWDHSSIEFMPVNHQGESWTIYGDNLPEIVQRKIDWMIAHRNDTPRVYENQMWLMPDGFPVPMQEYLKY